MAFAPDYARSGRFYVYFTGRDGNPKVQEFRRSASSPNRANKSTRRQLMSMADPYPNHNGGHLVFGPDGLLYIGTGDGGSGGDPENRAQNLDSPARQDPAHRPAPPRLERVPLAAVEPVRGTRRAQRDLRLRPAQPVALLVRPPHGRPLHRRRGPERAARRSTTRPRGQARGRNYGWSCFEGRSRFDDSRNCPNPVGPVLEYGRSGGECSVTGGVVVARLRRARSAGRYVYGDFCAGRLRSFRIQGGRATEDRAWA